MYEYFIPTQAWAPVSMDLNHLNVRPKRPLPTRAEQIESLEKEQFDVLVIGGGATGTGCALDATTRGKSPLMFSST
jgi:alkyl hydroperoxide reductase subunit AhpF